MEKPSFAMRTFPLERPQKVEDSAEISSNRDVNDIASGRLINKVLSSPDKNLSVSKPIDPKISVDLKSLGSAGPGHLVAIERTGMGDEGKKSAIPNKPQEFYDKIIVELRNKESIDPEELKKSIDVGLKTIKSLSKEGVEGITLKLTESDHIILYLGEQGEDEFIKYSGKAQPSAADIEFIAQGSFGLVQKAGGKALKTIRQEKGPRAKQDIVNAINNLKSLHSAYPGGKAPNIETTPKHIWVAIEDPKTKEVSFIDGSLSPLIDADLTSVGPNMETGMFPKMSYVLNGYADIFGALAFMHAQGVPHCDLKPQNIYIIDGKFFLGDFGSVRKASDWNEDNFMSGTKQYMPFSDNQKFVDAFEHGDVKEAQNIREKMDVFALAASAFNTITGLDVYVDLYDPHADDSDYIDTSVLAEDGNAILDEIAIQYNDEVKKFFLKALSPNMDERPTALECQTMLLKILN